MSSNYNFGQYSTGGGTEDGDHGGPGGYYSKPNSTTDYTEVAKDVAILFLSGVAILVALISLVYVGAIFCDRFCRRCCGCFRSLHTDGPRYIQGGEVARDAGLTGMTEEERRAVLSYILEGKPYHTHKENADGAGKDGVEGQSDDLDNSTADDDTDNSSPEPTPAQDIESPPSADQFESDSYIACAICIDEYGPDDEVVVGEACQHMFHKDCVLDWLQRHDGCPCCRKNMITSDQMRQAAPNVLGRERVLQLALGPYASSLGFATSSGALQPQPQAADIELGNVGDGFQNDTPVALTR